jgi:hypothetical protein
MRAENFSCPHRALNAFRATRLDLPPTLEKMHMHMKGPVAVERLNRRRYLTEAFHLNPEQ